MGSSLAEYMGDETAGGDALVLDPALQQLRPRTLPCSGSWRGEGKPRPLVWFSQLILFWFLSWLHQLGHETLLQVLID